MSTGFEIIIKYFPGISEKQAVQFSKLQNLYAEWNEKINVISRKDIDFLYERHVLHSLALAKIIRFAPGTKILDAGTGGGFPGIPLAILFPECGFHLVDSIGKKIKVVQAVTEALGLANVTAEQKRMEEVMDKFDFVVTRAVAEISQISKWLKGKVSPENRNSIPNGIFFYKGGDVDKELKGVDKKKTTLFHIESFFKEDFFREKLIIHLSFS